MKKKVFTILVLSVVLCLCISCKNSKSPYIAYSLSEAEYRLRQNQNKTKDLTELGGITRLAGMIYDKNRDELIIVGQADKRGRKITLDDIAVAMRSVLLLKEYPLVSIDRTEETNLTGFQTVRFQGGVENTGFGRDMLQADIALKELSMGLLSSDNYDVQSYLHLSLDQLKQKIVKASGVLSGLEKGKTDFYYSLPYDQLQKEVAESCREFLGRNVAMEISEKTLSDQTRIGSRFWLYPFQPGFVDREGIITIQDLDVCCLTQVLYAVINGNPESDLSSVQDEIGGTFSSQVTLDFGKVARSHPELGRIKSLFDLVALGEGLTLLEPKPSLEYWLKEYQIKKIKTRTSVGLISSVTKFLDPQNRLQLLEISGGLELNPLFLRVEAGDITALKEIVLKSRPDREHVLMWVIPIQRWRMPGAGKYYEIDEKIEQLSERHSGFSLDIKLIEIGPPIINTENYLKENFFPFDGAGVNIDPQPKSGGTPPKGIWENVIFSRPSDSSLFWDINIPPKE